MHKELVIGFPHTVSILSVGVWLEGKNRFFDTNRKDRNCMLTLFPSPSSYSWKKCLKKWEKAEGGTHSRGIGLKQKSLKPK